MFILGARVRAIALACCALAVTPGAASPAPSLQPSSIPLSCKSQSQPNPIAADYPHDVTGTINGTTAVVLIPLDVARSVIPKQYAILTAAYKAVFPSLPEGMYPAVLEAVQDHDVQMSPLKIPDFSRIALKYPFVDRLNDGYTSFKYTPPQLISDTNAVALLGSASYGATIPGNFDPPCDAYAGNASGGKSSATYLIAYAAPKSKELDSKPDFDTRFSKLTAKENFPYSLKAFVNVTNQPTFGSGIPVCDNYITLFNSSVTMGKYAPVPVKGTVKVEPPFYPTEQTFSNVFGYRMDNSFIERNDVPCQNLQGYHGTGPGDSG